FSSRRRHTRSKRDWSSDVCSSDLEAGAGVPGGLDQGVVHRQELGPAGGLLQGNVDDVPALDAHHAAVLLLHDHPGGGGAEAGGQDPVVGAGGAASLVVTGDGDPGLLAGDLLQLVGDAVGDGGVGVGVLPAAALLLGKDLVVLGD